MSVPVVLQAKLTPPTAARPGLVRTDLLARFHEARDRKVILLHAPAGFGKTTAMAQLHERRQAEGARVAWLTLDRDDNDATRFLACLAMALGVDPRAAPKVSGAVDPLALPFAPLHALAAEAGGFVLFLDEFEVIHDAAVLGLVQSLIDYLPAGAQVVIGSRTVLDLRLSRLRAYAGLVEFDAADLRFSLAESRSLFRQASGADVEAGTVERLHARTDGWPTGLLIGAHALAKTGGDARAVDSLVAGDDPTLARYLHEEILSLLSPETRRFLLGTCILRHVDLAVCQSIMPEIDTGRALKELERLNLFLVSVSGSRRTLRYHNLLRDFLRVTLCEEQGEGVAALHRRASEAHEALGRDFEAVEHAIAGGDSPRAVRLLRKVAAAALEDGRVRLLDGWFRRLPEADLAAAPDLLGIALSASIFTRGADRTALQVAALPPEAEADPLLASHLNALRPLILAMQDHYDRAVELGRENLKRLPTLSRFADNLLRNCMAEALNVMGFTGEAQRLVDASAMAAPGRFNAMYAESIEGLMELQAGHVRRAHSRFRAAAQESQLARHDFSSGNAWAAILYAVTLYEMNAVEEAERLVQVYLPIARDTGLPGHTNVAHMIQARIAFAQGDVDLSFEAMLALEHLGRKRGLPRLVANARLERARLLILLGREAAAREEIDRADDPALWSRILKMKLPANELEYPAVARARWEIHFGDAAAAAARLQEEWAQASAAGRHRRAFRLKVLIGLAHQRAGNSMRSADEMTAALRFAMNEGFLRTIVDEGAEARQLVRRLHTLHEGGMARHADRKLLAFMKQLCDAFEGAVPPGGPGTERRPVEARPVEALTRKEIQILLLTADGFSNEALAARLAISESTVRTHLRNINAKLGARSRGEAVAIARRLSIIR